MKNMYKFLGVIALVVIITFLMTVCDNDTGNGTDNGTDNGSKAPEDLPVAERWYIWGDETSTVTVNYSVDSSDVCTIIVGGTAGNSWDRGAGYNYTKNANTSYEYTFEAWTQSGNRDLSMVYYYDWDTGFTLAGQITITDTRTTYTISGRVLPKAVDFGIDFHCGNQLGTFYIKILSITPTKTLAIQGIPPALMMEFADYSYYMLGLFPISTTVQQALQIAENYYQTGDTGSIVATGRGSSYTNDNPTTVYFPLADIHTGYLWEGSGSYMIGILLYSYYHDNQRAFWTGPINFTSSTTTITFNPNWEVIYLDN